MMTVNSLSGGKTSSYMALTVPADVNIFACVCIDHLPAQPKDSEVLKYCLEKLNGDFIASAENEMTLKVMMDLEQILGKNIVWVRGKSFDRVIDEAGCLPTWARRFCTTELKVKPIFEYVYPRYGEVIMNIGFRADERDRISEAQKNGLESKFFSPVSCNIFGKKRQNWEIIEYGQKEFPLRRVFHHQIKSYLKTTYPHLKFPFDSNCEGCHHKHEELLSYKYRKYQSPVMDWFSMQEQKGKYNTWKDSRIPYAQIFKTEYPVLFDYELQDNTMCNSGFCTD